MLQKMTSNTKLNNIFSSNFKQFDITGCGTALGNLAKYKSWSYIVSRINILLLQLLLLLEMQINFSPKDWSNSINVIIWPANLFSWKGLSFNVKERKRANETVLRTETTLYSCQFPFQMSSNVRHICSKKSRINGMRYLVEFCLKYDNEYRRIFKLSSNQYFDQTYSKQLSTWKIVRSRYIMISIWQKLKVAVKLPQGWIIISKIMKASYRCCKM